MTQFHTDEYVDFLKRITPENMHRYEAEQEKHGMGLDCPVFDGVFEFSSISAGGSLEAAARLARGKCDIAINWAGGLHHAKKESAGGFCYINGTLFIFQYDHEIIVLTLSRHCVGNSGTPSDIQSCPLHFNLY
jgi:histone deacetylase 1/2